ncbi:MAG TPA: alpha/beta hydrolase [Puia sp.]|nr:alpha/beta hydrolase [Puia sp.]
MLLRTACCLLLLLTGYTNHAQTIHYGDNNAAGHYLNTRGIRLYYETYGKGDPLLLLHMNGESMKVFYNQIPWFSQYYRVIAVDSCAHGKSVDASDSLSFEEMADDFNALCDSLHIDSCYVIGWSDGGISALLLALRHPEKIRKMVVSGPNLWPDTTGVVPYIFHLMERTADSLHHKGSLTAAEKNLLKTTELDLYQPHITLEQLHAIKCPTMVVGGDHDAIPSLHLWQMAQNIPQSYLWIVPNSGHSVVIYKKAQFNPLVNDFFRKPYRRIEGMDVMK